MGLDALIKLDKDFLNKQAYLDLKDKTPRENLVCFEIDADQDADASGGEPIFLPDGTPAGRVTSGAYGYSVDKSIAVGFLKHDLVKPGDELDVYILGKPHKARLLAEPLFDPKGEKLRS